MKQVCIYLILIIIFSPLKSFSQKVIPTDQYSYPNFNSYESTIGVASIKTPKGRWWNIKLSPLNRSLNRKKAYVKIRFYKASSQTTNQPCSSPELVFLLTGVTGRARDGLANFIARFLTLECLDVIIMPSIFNSKFVNAVSKRGIIGSSKYDVRDFYNFMQRSQSYIEKSFKRNYSDINILGYSLGGLCAAYLNLLDQEEKIFNFKKILMLNPPVNLEPALKKIDSYKRSLSRMKIFTKTRMLSRIGSRIIKYRRIKSDINSFTNFVNDLKLSKRKMKALIGHSLSKELPEIVLSTKYILEEKRDIHLNILPNVRRRKLKKLAKNFNYKKYFQSYVLTYRHTIELEPKLSYSKFLALNSMPTLTDMLKKDKSIHVHHNKDDLIINESDIRYLKQTFKDRLTLYPRGGHMGNIVHPLNINEIKKVFK